MIKQFKLQYKLFQVAAEFETGSEVEEGDNQEDLDIDILLNMENDNE